MGLYCNGGGMIVGYEGANLTITYPLASGTHNITMASNVTLAYTDLYVDGVRVVSAGLNGLGAGGTNTWLCESGPARSTNWVKYRVGNTLKADIQSYGIISGSTIPDMSGSGNTATIVWGTNPTGLSVSTSGIAATGSYAMGSSTIDPDLTPEIIPVPGSVNLSGDPTHTSTPPIIPTGYDPAAPDPMAGVDPITPGGLPVYELVNRAATSLGWTANTLYAALMWMTAIAMGAGAFIATGSLLGGGIMLAGTLAVASSTGVIPAWIPIVMGLALVFIVVMSRSM